MNMGCWVCKTQQSVMFACLMSRTFSANKQCFSLTINQPTILFSTWLISSLVLWVCYKKYLLSGRRALLTLIVNSNCNFTLTILVLWFYFHFLKTKVINVIYLYFDNFTSLLHFFKPKLALLSDANTTYAPLSLVTQCSLDCSGSR